MTLFEFVSVLIGVILALALSQLLLGASALIKARRRVIGFGPHTLWMVNLFVLIIFQWWAMWDLREAPWTSAGFLYVMTCPTVLFLSVSLLIPEMPDSATIDLGSHFHEVRRLFMGLLIVYLIFVWFDGAFISGQSPWGRQIVTHLGFISGLGIGFVSDGARGNYVAALIATTLLSLNMVFRFLPAAFA